MNLITQPNRVTCLPCSLAMVADVPLEKIQEIIGHDGLKKLWPEKDEPHCYQGYGETEIMEAALELGWALIPITFSPLMQSLQSVKQIPMYTPEQVENRLDKYLPGNTGIISGYTAVGRVHAVAWDGRQVYDPEGRIYSFEESGISKIEIVTFFMAKFLNQ